MVRRLRPDARTCLGVVDDLEGQILAELEARGGFWSLGDHSSSEEINSELGVSKRTFKQATGALWKKRKIIIEKNGIRLGTAS